MTTYRLQPPRYYRPKFDGSDRLFRACWRQYRGWLNGAIDAPACDDDVMDWLEQIAAQRVNDGDSPFYMYG